MATRSGVGLEQELLERRQRAEREAHRREAEKAAQRARLARQNAGRQDQLEIAIDLPARTALIRGSRGLGDDTQVAWYVIAACVLMTGCTIALIGWTGLAFAVGGSLAGIALGLTGMTIFAEIPWQIRIEGRALELVERAHPLELTYRKRRVLVPLDQVTMQIYEAASDPSVRFWIDGDVHDHEGLSLTDAARLRQVKALLNG